MADFKKAYNLKIISILVAVIFFFTNTVYGIDLLYNSHLRKPLDLGSKSNTRELMDRMGKIIDVDQRVEDGNESKLPMVDIDDETSAEILGRFQFLLQLVIDRFQDTYFKKVGFYYDKNIPMGVGHDFAHGHIMICNSRYYILYHTQEEIAYQGIKTNRNLLQEMDTGDIEDSRYMMSLQRKVTSYMPGISTKEVSQYLQGRDLEYPSLQIDIYREDDIEQPELLERIKQREAAFLPGVPIILRIKGRQQRFRLAIQKDNPMELLVSWIRKRHAPEQIKDDPGSISYFGGVLSKISRVFRWL